MTESDGYLDDEAIREDIRREVELASSRDYDYDGHGSLPLRPDVRGYVERTLAAPGRGVLRAGGLPPPEVTLKPDGTLQLNWRAVTIGAGLILVVPCTGIVLYRRFDRGFALDGTFRHLLPAELGKQLDALLDGLRASLGHPVARWGT